MSDTRPIIPGMGPVPSVPDLMRMVRRLTLKLERVDGKSLATEDARRLVDFDLVELFAVEISEA